MCTCSRETEFLAYLPTSSIYASSLLSHSILRRMVLIFCGQSSPGSTLGVALCCSAPSRAFLSRGIRNLVFEQLMGNVSSSSLVCRQTRPEVLWTRRVSTPNYCFSFGHSTMTSSSIPQSSLFFSAWLSGVLSRSGRYISVGLLCPHPLFRPPDVPLVSGTVGLHSLHLPCFCSFFCYCFCQFSLDHP